MDLTQKDQLIQYLKANGLWAKKSLGQNFLVDRVALDKIVEAAELKNTDTVLEIGPGVGTLTEELVKKAGSVIAVEKDRKLSELLHRLIASLPEDKNNHETTASGGVSQNAVTIEQSNNEKLKIIEGDVLDFDPKKLQANSYKLIANIPYYITSKILAKFLSEENKPELIVLLVQKEVAERICAKPGALSLLAISVQYFGYPEIVDIVKRDSFFPAPEVDSAILKIRIKNSEHSKSDEEYFFKIVKAGFSARRKTLFNNFKSGTNIPREKISDIIKRTGFEQNVRAQELSVEDWQNLIREIKKAKNE